jgi:signal transduction histidine kinase
MSTQLAYGQLPAGAGKGRHSNLLAIVNVATSGWRGVPPRIHQWGLTEALDPWTRDVAQGLIGSSEQCGFNPLWYHWRRGETPEDLLRLFISLGVDAVVVLTPREEHLPLITLLAEHEVPVVVAYARHPDPRIPWVACDNCGGMVRSVSHLAQLGHGRIGFLGGTPTVPDFLERKQGFLDGMAAVNLPVDPELMLECPSPRTDLSDVGPLAEQLLSHPRRPTAVACATDTIAAAVLGAAWKIGLQAPEDVAVVGFDDSELAVQVIPELTSVRQPVLEIANQVCYLAACAVVGQVPETGGWQLDLPTTLVVRASCGAASHEELTHPSPPSHGTQIGDRTELERRLHQLVQTTEEMRELLSIASHDLRSPLVSILGFASSIESRYRHALDEYVLTRLARIRHNAEHMDGLITTLLDVSRSHNQPLNFESVPVSALVASVRRDLESLILQSGANIVIQGELPTVVADATGLRQVFTNLLTNALRYRGDQPEPQIVIGYLTRPAEYEFYVQDNGHGISPEHHEAIFRLFRRGPHTESEGAGVGLTTVRTMISRHGGRVWVESELGAGATFRFTLPRRGEKGHVEPGAQAA